MTDIIPRSLGTHDGTFHGDEVTACALLLLCNRIVRDQIYRTRNPEVLATCEFVCDVGGEYDSSIKRFDHHQVDYQGSLSSAGMILQFLHEEGDLSDTEYKGFNESLIMGVDAHDIGKAPVIEGHSSFSHVISNFIPVRRDASSEEEDQAFHQALDFVIGHLQRLRDRIHYIESCEAAVKKAMEQYEDCMIFDVNIPWIENFFQLGGEDHPVRFIIMPAGIHWKLRGVPPTFAERMQVREPLPQSWAGLLEEQLQEETGIPGAIFCHKGRFISVWETKEDAYKAYEAVKKFRNQESRE